MYNSLDLVLILIELLVCSIVFAIVKGWYDNRRWEKRIYKILEQYRAKYGVDQGCEMLMYTDRLARLSELEQLKEELSE